MLEKNWIRIGNSFNDLPFEDNGLCEIAVEGRTICLGRHQENHFAFAATCPHAGASFAKGFIDSLGNVVCPRHRYKFVMGNGYNCSGEGFKLKTYPLETRADGVYVGVDL